MDYLLSINLLLMMNVKRLILQTFMDLTRLAVVLATSLADWTNCLLATGLGVLEEARRQALHSAEVCLATMVAAESTWAEKQCTGINK